MSNEDGTVWLKFESEIYNFKKLRLLLKKNGHCFHSTSDTEVLIHLYENYRSDMLSLLDSDFTFYIVDKRDRIILLARYPLKMKPLYYTLWKNTFIFASEPKALLHIRGFSRKLSSSGLASILVYNAAGCISAYFV